jgi:hypothetical protein
VEQDREADRPYIEAQFCVDKPVVDERACKKRQSAAPESISAAVGVELADCIRASRSDFGTGESRVPGTHVGG